MAEDQELPTPTEVEQNIKWEVVDDPTRLRKLLSETLRETLYQDFSVVFSGISMLSDQDEESQKEYIKGIKSATDSGLKRIKRLQQLLKQDPTQPLPINYKYPEPESAIIELDIESPKP